MATLSELLKALVTITVRYHQIISNSSDEVSTDLRVNELLTLTLPEFSEALVKIIEEATEEDATRHALLNYLFYASQMIHPYATGQHSLTEPDINSLQKTISDLMVNVLTLLNTNQSTQLMINYEGKTTQHYGLRRSILMGASWSRLGVLLNEMLLPVFDLTYLDTPKQATMSVKCMMQDEQLHSLRKQTLSQQARITDLNEMVAAKDTLIKGKDYEISALAQQIRTLQTLVSCPPHKRSTISAFPFSTFFAHRLMPLGISPGISCLGKKLEDKTPPTSPTLK